MLTIQYEIFTKSELFFYLSESYYLVASDKQRTENNKSLEMAAITAVFGLIFLVIEFMTFGKLRNIKSLFLSLFQHLFFFTIMKTAASLPVLVEWGLAYVQHPALGRLKTYDQQTFRKVE